MSESARMMKANKVMEGTPCRWCGRGLSLGQDVAVCESCQAVHHATCWDKRAGCSNTGCVNAPLTRMAEPPGPTTPPEPTRPIPGGPQPTAPGAVATLVYGILALFICGPLFGTIAIVKANKVKRFIAENPQYGGEGYATAGLVLGIVALVLFALVVLFQLASGA